MLPGAIHPRERSQPSDEAGEGQTSENEAGGNESGKNGTSGTPRDVQRALAEMLTANLAAAPAAACEVEGGMVEGRQAEEGLSFAEAVGHGVGKGVESKEQHNRQSHKRQQEMSRGPHGKRPRSVESAASASAASASGVESCGIIDLTS